MAFRLKPTEHCKENYIPSQRKIRRFWLGTKKSGFSIGRQEFPGLIDYNEDLWPALGFTVGLVSEVVGLYLLFQAGLDWRAAVALGVVDIFFAALRHMPVAKLCEYKNKLLVTPDGPPLSSVKKKIKRQKIYIYTLSIPILCICLIKILGFINFIGGIDPNGLLVIVSYVIVAIIHLTLTGYFFWWLPAEIGDYIDHKKYRDAIDKWGEDHPGVFPPYPPPVIGAECEIKTASGYDPIKIDNLRVAGYVVGRHILINTKLLVDGRLPQELYREFEQPDASEALYCTAEINKFLSNKNESIDDNDEYTLFTWGILTDEQIKNFCNLLPVSHSVMEKVAREFLRYQLNQFLGIAVEFM